MKIIKKNSVLAPKISVILPVFNGQEYLYDSIKSILNQTFENFELLIINDGSTDNSSNVINSFDDFRITYIEQKNQGLGATLNILTRLARGEFIARQDQDDISMPRRLEKQFSELVSDLSLNLIGSWAKIVDAKSLKYIGEHRHFKKDIEIRYNLIFDNPFVHSSVIFRKDSLKLVGGYFEGASGQFPEDFDLWQRFMEIGKSKNISEYLIIYRSVKTGMSRNFALEHKAFMVKLCWKNFQRMFANCENINMEHFFKVYHRSLKDNSSKLTFSILMKNLEKIEEMFLATYLLEASEIAAVTKEIKIALLKSIFKCVALSPLCRIKSLIWLGKEMVI